MLAVFVQFLSAVRTDNSLTWCQWDSQNWSVEYDGLSNLLIYLQGFHWTRFNFQHCSSRPSWEVFHIQVQTLLFFIVSNPSLPNTLWVGVWTHKHLLRRPVGSPNRFWKILVFIDRCLTVVAILEMVFTVYVLLCNITFQDVWKKRVAVLVQYSRVTMVCTYPP